LLLDPPGILNFNKELVQLRLEYIVNVKPASVVNNEYVQQATVRIAEPNIHTQRLRKIIVLKETEHLEIRRKKKIDSSPC